METENDESPELARAALEAWRNIGPGSENIDAMQIAAWLEGRLDVAASANVERLLAADPALLDAILTGNVAPLEATPREIEAARALVRSPWWQRLVPKSDALQDRVGTAVAAAVLVASVGTAAFELGEAFAGVAVAQQSAAMRSMMSNDLLDMPGEN